MWVRWLGFCAAEGTGAVLSGYSMRGHLSWDAGLVQEHLLGAATVVVAQEYLLGTAIADSPCCSSVRDRH